MHWFVRCSVHYQAFNCFQTQFLIWTFYCVMLLFNLTSFRYSFFRRIIQVWYQCFQKQFQVSFFAKTFSLLPLLSDCTEGSGSTALICSIFGDLTHKQWGYHRVNSFQLSGIVYHNRLHLMMLVNDASTFTFYPSFQLPRPRSLCKHNSFIISLDFYLFCYKCS